ncbi:hypothetical protein CBM2595_A70033 [Cupriavidus taiwanensis]|nr:hypothetical protein CBM2595_A70033 [Cupriavidus taiwanensis]
MALPCVPACIFGPTLRYAAPIQHFRLSCAPTLLDLVVLAEQKPVTELARINDRLFDQGEITRCWRLECYQQRRTR